MAGSMATGLRKAGVDVRRVDLDEASKWTSPAMTQESGCQNRTFYGFQARFSPLLSEEERLTYFNENEQPQLTGVPVLPNRPT